MKPLLAAVFLALGALSVAADDFTLTSGEKISGDVTAEGDELVIVKTLGGESLRIPRREIASRRPTARASPEPIDDRMRKALGRYQEAAKANGETPERQAEADRAEAAEAAETARIASATVAQIATLVVIEPVSEDLVRREAKAFVLARYPAVTLAGFNDAQLSATLEFFRGEVRPALTALKRLRAVAVADNVSQDAAEAEELAFADVRSVTRDWTAVVSVLSTDEGIRRYLSRARAARELRERIDRLNK